MNAVKTSFFAALVAVTTACGTGNHHAISDQANSDASAPSQSEEQLGLSNKVLNDGCIVRVVGPTVFSKAAPQPLVIQYSFNYLSGGDRIVLRNPSVPNWKSGELSAKSGTLTIDITQLAAGEYNVAGLTNTYVTDKEKDCGVAKSIIIRNK